MEDPRIEEQLENCQGNYKEEITEEEPEPLKPVIDMIDPPQTVLNIGYLSGGNQAGMILQQNSQKLFSNKHFLPRNKRR